MPRRRLRVRVFGTTAVFGLMLIGIVVLLSWRAQLVERDLMHIISTDMRAIDDLNDFARAQNGFLAQWRAAAQENPAQLVDVAARYRMIEQVLDSRSVRGADTGELKPLARRFAQTIADLSTRWQELPPEGREAAMAILTRESSAVTRAANNAIARSRAEIDQKLPRYSDDASKLMWTGLAISYMVLIVGIATARITLKKVVQPIEQLSRAAEKIAAGDHSARAPIGGDREVAQLGESFNRMAKSIEQSAMELSDRARTDELTSMANFRAFRERIDGEIDRASRYGQPFGVLVFDLDHFKKYNDTWGHLAGNEALKAVAETIRTTLRSVDFPARYGGEEFAAILPEVDAERMIATAERVRKAIQQIPPIGERAGITISVGCALYPADGFSAEDLFRAADERLYAAKKKGRNRVVGPEKVAVTTT